MVDKSYVMNMLRQKIQEAFSEVDKNRKEVEVITKDNALYLQLEKRQDELLKEVRNLEGANIRKAPWRTTT